MAGVRTPAAFVVGLLSSCLLVVALAFAPSALALTSPVHAPSVPKPAATAVHTATATVQNVAPTPPSTPPSAPSSPAAHPPPAPAAKPAAPPAPKPASTVTSTVTHAVQPAHSTPTPKPPSTPASPRAHAVHNAAAGTLKTTRRALHHVASRPVHSATGAIHRIRHAAPNGPATAAAGTVKHVTGSVLGSGGQLTHTATHAIQSTAQGVTGAATHAIQSATAGLTGAAIHTVQETADGLTGAATHAIRNTTTGLTGAAIHAIRNATTGLGGTLQNVVDHTRGTVGQIAGQVPPRHLLPPPVGTQIPPAPGAPSGPSGPSGTIDPLPTLNDWQPSDPFSSSFAGRPAGGSGIGSQPRSIPADGIRADRAPLGLSPAPQAPSDYEAAPPAANDGPSDGTRSPLLPSPAAQSGSGSSTGAGIALALAALLVALMAVRPPQSLRRLAIAPATLRPAPELGSPDRPG